MMLKKTIDVSVCIIVLWCTWEVWRSPSARS